MGMEKPESRMTDRLLTQREVCARLGICPTVLQRLRKARKIAYLRFGHRSIRFREQAVEDFLKRREFQSLHSLKPISQGAGE
jgi:excisionase family DNA binding protein